MRAETTGQVFAALPRSPHNRAAFPPRNERRQISCGALLSSLILLTGRSPHFCLNIGCRAHPWPLARLASIKTRWHGRPLLRHRAPAALPSHSREKMRCADFRVLSLRVRGPQPLPPTAQVILLSRAVTPAESRARLRREIARTDRACALTASGAPRSPGASQLAMAHRTAAPCPDR